MTLPEGIQWGSQIQKPKGPPCSICLKICAEPIWTERGEGPFCSSSCHDERPKGLSQNKLREIAWERDQGVCTCGTDTKVIEALKPSFATEELWIRWASKLYRFTEKHLRSGVYWHADHIRERAAAGVDDPSNIQTLCRPCHDEKSGEFQSKRLRKRGFGRG